MNYKEPHKFEDSGDKGVKDEPLCVCGLSQDYEIHGKVIINDIDRITQAIKKVGAYGSVEIYLQDSKITQITTRSITKVTR